MCSQHFRDFILCVLSLSNESVIQEQRVDSYLVLSNILASGHRELSSIDISIESHTLERTQVSISESCDRYYQQGITLSV